MPVIESHLDPQSSAFKINAETMHAALNAVRAIEQHCTEQALHKKAQYAQRGDLLPRERLARLLDQGMPFLELSSLAGYKMYDDKEGTEAGANVIGGVGYVSGIRSIVNISNYTIKGGTLSPISVQKGLRLQRIALENKLPMVGLIQSGGGNLNYQAELFVEGARTFYNQARASAAGLPQITVVHGNATAGGAYIPGMSDYTIVIRKKSKMFLAGPQLTKAATGEITDDETLGGAELHAARAGTAEFLAENDTDGIRYAREIMAKLPWNEHLPLQNKPSYQEPLYSPEELMGIATANIKQPYDCREIIARIADASDFLDFKIEYDQQTICGWIKIQAHSCGVIGNNGPITVRGATKAAQFIQLCDQSNIPLLFLHNTTGFMVGTESEAEGIIKHGSKMLQAVANTRVPKISIILGGSYGAGHYAMCGRGMEPRFIFSWPIGRVAVMGGPQAAQVLRMVTEEKYKKLGQALDPARVASMEQMALNKVEEESTTLYGTARLWDDGIIDPRDTRKVTAFILDICREADLRKLSPNTFGVARF